MRQTSLHRSTRRLIRIGHLVSSIEVVDMKDPAFYSLGETLWEVRVSDTSQ
jgi:hypothetical protein